METVTTYQVSELEGALLDAAVAKALGDVEPLWTCREHDGERSELLAQLCLGSLRMWSPSRDWSIAGPIIDREKIAVEPTGCSVTASNEEVWSWEAVAWSAHISEGPTPLIAAMRAYVASKFGDTVDL